MPKDTDFKKIQLLVLDVDGVLTDASIVMHGRTGESKCFNSRDGHGIRLWKRAGLKVAFISGRKSKPTKRRAKEFDVDYLFENCYHKLETLKKLLEYNGLSADKVACIGDDLPDLPMISYVGFGAAVADAVQEVKNHADYITSMPGGKGAVREVIELILKNSGRWGPLMERYLPNK
ncbi:MAG: KdsC family phosphatase [Planctomycetota bacterium]|jgi:3-deoxy-D-manno-octulosonate 8-phosphate phosphatase (KDO 8-P phosphatase)